MQQAVATGVAGEALVGVRELASMTGVSPSTVTRYVQRYPDLGVTVGGVTKVRRDAYLASRTDNPAVPAAEVVEQRQTATVIEMPARAAKARHEEAKAELAELELMERKGALVAAEAIRRELATIAQALRDALLSADTDFVERLMAAADARTATAMLIDHNRALLERLADSLSEAGVG